MGEEWTTTVPWGMMAFYLMVILPVTLWWIADDYKHKQR